MYHTTLPSVTNLISTDVTLVKNIQTLHYIARTVVYMYLMDVVEKYANSKFKKPCVKTVIYVISN